MNENYIYSAVKKSAETVTIHEVNVSLETKLQDLYLDSLDAVEFVMGIEKELNIQLPDSKCVPIIDHPEDRTISDLVKLIHNYVRINYKDLYQ